MLSYKSVSNALIATDAVPIYFSSLVRQMRAAVLTGLSDDDASLSEVSGFSSTGKCTFGTYWSMGICSFVEDVTPIWVADCGKGGDEIKMACTYTVPEIQNTLPPKNPGMSGLDTAWTGAGYTGTTNRIFSDINTLVKIYVIYLSDQEALDDNSKLKYTSKMVALKGKLDFCLFKYNSSMQLGITSTNQIDQNANPI
ncbi:MAG: hypothetical protein Q9175_003670 [Cornicularia normoerica]